MSALIPKLYRDASTDMTVRHMAQVMTLIQRDSGHRSLTYPKGEL